MEAVFAMSVAVPEDQFQMSSVHIFGMQVAWKVAAVGVLLLVPHKAEWP